MHSGYERQLLPKKYTPYILGCQSCYWCSFLWLGALLPLRHPPSPQGFNTGLRGKACWFNSRRGTEKTNFDGFFRFSDSIRSAKIRNSHFSKFFLSSHYINRIIVLNCYWTFVIRLEEHSSVCCSVLCWSDKFNVQVEKVLECRAEKIFGSKREK